MTFASASHRLGGVRFLAMAAALVAPAFVWEAPARATMVVQDTWRDGTRSDPGSATYSEFANDLDGDGNVESAWFNSPSANMTMVAPGGGAVVPGSPNIMRVTVPASANDSFETYFTQPGGAVTLANTGDFIKVTWAFTATGVATAGSTQGFNFALANTNGVARLTGDSGSPASGAYKGYAMYTNMKTGNLGNANSFQLRERGTTNGAFLSASGEWTSLANGATTATPGYTEGGSYQYVMQITLNASAGLDITSTMSGTGLGGAGVDKLTVSFTDATPNTLSYDMFGVRPSSAAAAASQFDTSLFQVETNTAVPEVSSFLMVGLVGAGGLAIRRLRRKTAVAVVAA
jgi:hypothetical protein